MEEEKDTPFKFPDRDADHTPTQPVNLARLRGEKFLTDSEAAQALTSGDDETFDKWMVQHTWEAKRRPNSVLEYALGARIANIYVMAALTEGRKKHFEYLAKALSMFENTRKAVRERLPNLTYEDPQRRELQDLLTHIDERDAQIREEIKKP